MIVYTWHGTVLTHIFFADRSMSMMSSWPQEETCSISMSIERIIIQFYSATASGHLPRAVYEPCNSSISAIHHTDISQIDKRSEDGAAAELVHGLFGQDVRGSGLIGLSMLLGLVYEFVPGVGKCT